MKVALYARVSSEQQAEKDLSIPSQLKALRKFASERNWETYGEFVDEAQSARSANRPKFQEMISIAKQKESPFKAILVWKLSRFARNREDSIIYKTLLRKQGVEVISINERIDDSPSGKLLEGIIEAIDEFYSSNLSHDTIRGMKENAKRGFLNGGTTPYGYKRAVVKVGNVSKSRLEVDNLHAPVVKRIYKLCLQGLGAKEITRVLNSEGLKTKRGGFWEVNAIHFILKNETYTGLRVFNRIKKGFMGASCLTAPEELRTENAHPAIIGWETFAKAQEIIAKRSPKYVHPRTIASNYLLSGFLYCKKCGSHMVGCAAKTSRFFYYGCHNKIRRGSTGCDQKLVRKEKIEYSVIDKLKTRVLTEENLTKLVQLVNEELQELSNNASEKLSRKGLEVQRLQERLDRLYESLESGSLDVADLAPRIQGLKLQISELEREKAKIHLESSNEKIRVTDSDVRKFTSDLHDLLAKGSLLERKSFLRSWIKRIDYSAPGKGVITYTLPIGPHTRESNGLTEVLSLVQTGVGNGI